MPEESGGYMGFLVFACFDALDNEDVLKMMMVRDGVSLQQSTLRIPHKDNAPQ